MTKQLSHTNTSNIFQEQLNALVQNTHAPTLDQALILTIRFYEEYEIIGVDRDIRDNDMLLFQFGLYNFQDGNGESFNVNFTRQFYIQDVENDEFYQMGLTLYFDKQLFEGVENDSKWSIDFTTIAEWKNYIRSTQVFQKGKGLIPKSYNLSLDLT